MIFTAPAVTPVTTPELLIIAIAVLELDQEPEPVLLLREMVLPIQTLLAPDVELTVGREFTVKLAILPVDGAPLQVPDAVCVTVIVVDPKLLKVDVTKVPVPAVNIMEAVFPVAEFVPLKS